MDRRFFINILLSSFLTPFFHFQMNIIKKAILKKYLSLKNTLQALEWEPG